MPGNRIAPFEGTFQEGFASNEQNFEKLALALEGCSIHYHAMMMELMKGYVGDFAD